MPSRGCDTISTSQSRAAAQGHNAHGFAGKTAVLDQQNGQTQQRFISGRAGGKGQCSCVWHCHPPTADVETVPKLS